MTKQKMKNQDWVWECHQRIARIAGNKQRECIDSHMEITDFQGMSMLPASTTEAEAQLGEDMGMAKRAASWIDTPGKQTGGEVQSPPCKKQKCTPGSVAVKPEAAAVKSDAAPKKRDIIIELCSLESENLNP